MPLLLPQRRMELWLAMAHKHRTATIMLTTNWLVRLSLDHLVDTWVTTRLFPLGTRTPQHLKMLHPQCILQYMPPLSLLLKHLSHTSSLLLALAQPS